MRMVLPSSSHPYLSSSSSSSSSFSSSSSCFSSFFQWSFSVAFRPCLFSFLLCFCCAVAFRSLYACLPSFVFVSHFLQSTHTPSSRHVRSCVLISILRLPLYHLLLRIFLILFFSFFSLSLSLCLSLFFSLLCSLSLSFRFLYLICSLFFY